MKIVNNNRRADKKVLAVITADGDGLYLKGDGDEVFLLDSGGLELRAGAKWSVIAGAGLKYESKRVAIYEGEEITITF